MNPSGQIASVPLPARVVECGAGSLAELISEIRLHEIELQMQNDALCQANITLQESNQRYLDLYELAPLGYLTLSDCGQVAEANVTAAAMLGIERQELKDQPFSRFVAAPDRARWQHKFAGVMAQGGLQGFDLQLDPVDGEFAGPSAPLAGFSGQVAVVCLRVEAGPEGEAGHCVRMTLTDISEKKRMDLDLEQYQGHLRALVLDRTAELAVARDAAEAANRASSAFLVSMSHQIRTPLSAVLGLVHLLRVGGMNAQQSEMLDRMDASGRHLVSLINDSLDLARIDTDQLLLEGRSFILSTMVDAVLAIVSDSIRAKGLAFHIDISGLPQRLHGDPTRLAQMLVNYLFNALKFTETGRISLVGRLLEEDADSYLLYFAVSDTGIGLATEQQTQLFQAFVQADHPRGEHSGGSGLGLALTRRIAQLMGGEVGVNSRPGQGSTFWLSARLGKAEAESLGRPLGELLAGSAAARLQRDHQGARILLADDDDLTREVMQLMLGDLGLVLDLAVNGVEAVRLARQNDYALILMDVQMPLLDGLQATRAIRELPGKPATTILAMTANVLDEILQDCLLAGMNGYLLKPVDPERLFEELIKWLSR